MERVRIVFSAIFAPSLRTLRLKAFRLRPHRTVRTEICHNVETNSHADQASQSRNAGSLTRRNSHGDGRIRDSIYLSPCARSEYFSQLTGNSVYLKLDNLQRT